MSTEPNLRNQKKILVFLFYLLVGCTAVPEMEEQVEQEVGILYQDALKAVMEEPKDAASKFEEVERQHILNSQLGRKSWPPGHFMKQMNTIGRW